VAADVAEGGGGGGGRVSARLDVREDGRRGARRGEEEEGGKAVAALSQALMAPKFMLDDQPDDLQGRVKQQVTDPPRRTALDRTQMIPLSEMPINRAWRQVQPLPKLKNATSPTRLYCLDIFNVNK